MLDILSLGAGVQSSAVFLMSCKGVLPKFDVAIFADTMWEPDEVYRNLKILIEEGCKAGIPVEIVTHGDLRKDTLEGFAVKEKVDGGPRYASLPLTTKGEDEKIGRIMRQCTREYKVDPLEKYIRRVLLGLQPRKRAPKDAARIWFGISSDETRRIRQSKKHWKEHIYPLVGVPESFLDKAYSRDDCVTWMNENYPDFKPARSACLSCPFHTHEEWVDVMSNPAYRKDVIAADRAIRNVARFDKQLFLHRSGKPIEEVDFGIPMDEEDPGMREECLGYCGV